MKHAFCFMFPSEIRRLSGQEAFLEVIVGLALPCIEVAMETCSQSLRRLIRASSATACVRLGEGEQERSVLMEVPEPPGRDGRMRTMRWWSWSRREGEGMGEELLWTSSGSRRTSLHPTANVVMERCLQSPKWSLAGWGGGVNEVHGQLLFFTHLATSTGACL